MTLSFTCTITNLELSKSFEEMYRENPRKFLEHWLQGALSTIVEDRRLPPDQHTGALVGQPKVTVKIL